MRFSTRMVWAALADHARIMCYPDWHPARREIVCADPVLAWLPVSVWPAAVREWQRELGIPDMRTTDAFRDLDRTVPAARKAAVAAYRALFLDPAVKAWEDSDWWSPDRHQDASKPWPYRG